MSTLIGTAQEVRPLALPRELLRGQTAVVTGGSRGIGRATALRLAEAGANVVVNYVRERDAAESAAREIEELESGVVTAQGDVADPEEMERVCDAALRSFGHLDLLVANAGIWEGAPLTEMPESLWDRVLDVNLKGTWSACRAAARVMQRQGSGAIVIVSSTAGQRGESGYSNYAASKGGQISFTKALATELAPAIRVNCVAPGWVETELNDPVFGDDSYKDRVRRAIPLQRLATADDVALAIAYLASPWAQHITGEVLNVNGGAVMCG